MDKDVIVEIKSSMCIKNMKPLEAIKDSILRNDQFHLIRNHNYIYQGNFTSQKKKLFFYGLYMEW